MSPTTSPPPPRRAPAVSVFGRSRWIALGAAVALAAGLWWTRPDAPPPAAPAAAPASTDAAATPSRTANLPAVTLTLAPVRAGKDAPLPALAVPRGTALVHLRLTGDLPAATDLTAELSARDRDEVKRWPVDDAPVGADGATRVVTLPPYAVPAGAYTLTLWAGDADIVQRYVFTVTTP